MLVLTFCRWSPSEQTCPACQEAAEAAAREGAVEAVAVHPLVVAEASVAAAEATLPVAAATVADSVAAVEALDTVRISWRERDGRASVIVERAASEGHLAARVIRNWVSLGSVVGAE